MQTDFDSSKSSDQELVSATLKDRHSFALIIDRYQAPLKRYILRLGCADKNDVEDVLQETFLKCYVNLNSYDSDLKFSSWLYRIAHNETINFFRKRKSRPKPVTQEESLEIFEKIAEENNFFDDLLKESDAKERYNALNHLEEKCRSTIVLRYFEGKNYSEISDILKIPEGTVATNINRGKKKLNEMLLSKRTSI